jgi:hypothetical protein
VANAVSEIDVAHTGDAENPGLSTVTVGAAGGYDGGECGASADTPITDPLHSSDRGPQQARSHRSAQ